MSPELLLRELELVGKAPNAMPRLRRFVLDLAMSGRIVDQDSSENPVKLNATTSPRRSGMMMPGSGSHLSYPAIIALNVPPGWTMATVSGIAECLDYMREPVNVETRNVRTAGKQPHELFPYYGATQQQGWIDAFIFDEDLVLLGEDGVPFLDPLRPKAYVISGKTWVNNHAHVLRAVHATNRFLAIALNTADYRGRVMGATRSKLNQSQMATLPIPLPPLAEQHRIVAKVDELMALCDQLETAQARREVRRDRLRATSLQNLVATDESKENARFFLRHSARMITKPEHVSGVRRAILDLAVLGRLVQHVSEWMAVTPPRVCSLIVDGDHNPPPRQSRGVPHLTAKNVAGGKIRLDGCSYISEADFLITKKRYAPLVGDVLLTCVGTLGRTAIVPEGIVFSADRNLAALRPDPATCTSPFLKLVLDSPSAQRVIASASGQTAQPHIYLKDIRALEFMLPPLAEQDRIVAKVDELMVVCDELEQSLATEQTERGRLLDALLRDALEDALPARELELLGAR